MKWTKSKIVHGLYSAKKGAFRFEIQERFVGNHYRFECIRYMVDKDGSLLTGHSDHTSLSLEDAKAECVSWVNKLKKALQC